jgi:hypothetical protein
MQARCLPTGIIISLLNSPALLTPCQSWSNIMPMKAKPAKRYKRRLSRAALSKMSEGGSNGSVDDKARAGKLGWQALRDKLSSK